jgi:ATP-dependent Clp protease protease subunit
MPNFRVRNATPKVGEIYLYDVVGDDWWGDGVTDKSFAAALASLGKVDRIQLRINSEGGDVFQGFAIYNQLQRHPAHIEAHVDGLAASIASVILMAADEIHVADNARIMIHDPWGVAMGTADEMRQRADLLDSIKTSIVNTYVARTGLDAGRVVDLMSAETWMTAREALDNGFADVVTEPVRAAACYDLSRYRNAPRGFGGVIQRRTATDAAAAMTSAKLEDIARRAQAHATS